MMDKKELNPGLELIAKLIGELLVLVLIAWAFVAAFSLTWGQAILITYLYLLLRDTIRHPNS